MSRAPKPLLIGLISGLLIAVMLGVGGMTNRPQRCARVHREHGHRVVIHGEVRDPYIGAGVGGTAMGRGGGGGEMI